MHFPVFGESLKTEAILQWHPTLHAFTFWAEIWVGGKGREMETDSTTWKGGKG